LAAGPPVGRPGAGLLVRGLGGTSSIAVACLPGLGTRFPSPWLSVGRLTAITAGLALAEAQASRVPAGIPVVLITGMGPREFPAFVTEPQKQEYRNLHQHWLKFHTEWLAGVPRAQPLITENSGPDVPFAEPELIIHAIHQISTPFIKYPRHSSNDSAALAPQLHPPFFLQARPNLPIAVQGLTGK
jgi:hypothetical protein